MFMRLENRCSWCSPKLIEFCRETIRTAKLPNAFFYWVIHGATDYVWSSAYDRTLTESLWRHAMQALSLKQGSFPVPSLVFLDNEEESNLSS
jgi:hypothetical protein